MSLVNHGPLESGESESAGRVETWLNLPSRDGVSTALYQNPIAPNNPAIKPNHESGNDYNARLKLRRKTR